MVIFIKAIGLFNADFTLRFAKREPEPYNFGGDDSSGSYTDVQHKQDC
jgi:hypothetical protein